MGTGHQRATPLRTRAGSAGRGSWTLLPAELRNPTGIPATSSRSSSDEIVQSIIVVKISGDQSDVNQLVVQIRTELTWTILLHVAMLSFVSEQTELVAFLLLISFFR
jgi:hypothetical protein